MENTIIDIPANADIRDITAESGGAVSGDIRVTIKHGLSKQAAHQALQAISSALIGDQIKLD